MSNWPKYACFYHQRFLSLPSIVFPLKVIQVFKTCLLESQQRFVYRKSILFYIALSCLKEKHTLKKW